MDARFEANAVETRERFDHFEGRVEANAVETRERLDHLEGRVDANAADTRLRFDGVDARAEDLKRHIDATAAQMKMDFGTAVEDMRTDVQRVAESVLMVNAKLDREAADIRAEMRQGFAETQSLLRFSHGNLDDRVSALERAAK
jgi:hypothetical protein